MKNISRILIVILLSSCTTVYKEAVIEQKLLAESLPILDKTDYTTRPYIRSIDRGPGRLRDTMWFGKEYVLLETSPLETVLPGFRQTVLQLNSCLVCSYGSRDIWAQRGYVAVWRVKKNEIWLEKIHVKDYSKAEDAEPSKIVMKRLSQFVGKPLIDGRSKATWLTGIVQIDGKLLRKHQHWEEYYLKIEEGKIQEITRYTAPVGIYDDKVKLSAYLTSRLSNEVTTNLGQVDIRFFILEDGTLQHDKGAHASDMECKIAQQITGLPSNSITPGFLPPVKHYNAYGTDIFTDVIMLGISFDAKNKRILVE